MADAFQSDTFQSDTFQTTGGESGLKIKPSGISSSLEIGNLVLDDRTLKPSSIDSTNQFGTLNIIGGDLRGSGTSADPYQIWTFLDLDTIGKGKFGLDAYYKLMDDIDASPTANPSYNDGMGWLPRASLTGVLDGGNKTISNLYINRPEMDYVGLISSSGAYSGGYVKDLTLTNCNITGRDYTAGIMGYAHYGSLNNCHVNGIITGRNTIAGIVSYVYDGNHITNCTCSGVINGNGDVGGVLGFSTGGITISNCIVSSDINATSSQIGGIVGRILYGGLYIANCVYSGVLTSTGNNLGGIAGFVNYGGYINYCNVVDGEIKGSVNSDNVGGICGDRYSNNINYCRVTIPISGRDNIGGICGWMDGGGTMESCIFTGSINGRNNLGGILGNNYPYEHNGTVNKCFTNAVIVGTGENIGGLTGYLNGYVINSFSFSSVTGASNVGGAVGYANRLGSLENTYSKGLVVGVSNSGGLVGNKYDSTAIESNCYWDIETSGQNSSALGTGKSTDEMTYLYGENVYQGWDFSTIWSNIGENEYPWLIVIPRIATNTSILSTLSFGIPRLSLLLKLNSIVESISLGNNKLNLKLYPETKSSDIELGLLGLYLRYTISGIGIESSIRLGNINLGYLLYPMSIENVSYIGDLELYLRNYILINGLNSTFNSGNIKLNLKLYLDSLVNTGYIGNIRPALAPNLKDEGILNINSFGEFQLNLKLFIDSLNSDLEIPLPLIILFLKPSGLNGTSGLGILNLIYALGASGISSSLSFGNTRLNLRLFINSIIEGTDIGLSWIFIWYNNQYVNFLMSKPSTILEYGTESKLIVEFKKPVTSFVIPKPLTIFEIKAPVTTMELIG